LSATPIDEAEERQLDSIDDLVSTQQVHTDAVSVHHHHHNLFAQNTIKTRKIDNLDQQDNKVL